MLPAKTSTTTAMDHHSKALHRGQSHTSVASNHTANTTPSPSPFPSPSQSPEEPSPTTRKNRGVGQSHGRPILAPLMDLDAPAPAPAHTPGCVDGVSSPCCANAAAYVAANAAINATAYAIAHAPLTESAEGEATPPHAVLIHTGSKLFWQAHSIYAIQIFQHVDSDIIETIIYNTENDDPAVTVYLSLASLLPAVAVDIRLRYNSRIGHLNPIRDGAPSAAKFKLSNEYIHHEITDMVVSEFIVSHIIVAPAPTPVPTPAPATADPSTDTVSTAQSQYSVSVSRKEFEGEAEEKALTAVPAPPVHSDSSYTRHCCTTVCVCVCMCVCMIVCGLCITDCMFTVQLCNCISN
jgi:hypothetical protein